MNYLVMNYLVIHFRQVRSGVGDIGKPRWSGGSSAHPFDEESRVGIAHQYSP